jgi:hypothetical protein
MEKFILENQWLIWAVLVWTIPWKGVALWKSARNGHKIWFVVLFILNTLAILEILYIFIFSRKKTDEKQEQSDHPTGPNGNGINLMRGL